MSRKLVIVESPAKAKTIGQYLGKDFVVKASYGHVRDLPKNKLGIDVDDNFKVFYQLIPKAKKVVSDIQKELSASDELYLATDPDREGEAIAWHLVEQLKPKVPVHRVSFSEITKSAVSSAIEKPRQISKDLVDAQQARRILDRLVGYKLSPLLWKKVYRGLSAGRVQSVAVRLIVEREREIRAFVAREYWTLEVKLKSKSGYFPAIVLGDGANRLELKTEEEAQLLAKKLSSAELWVESLTTSESKLKPQPPLITSTLQQMAARHCNFSAKKTMKIAQDLYEGVSIPGMATVGLITYMRTDSYNIAETARAQAEKQIRSLFGERYLPTTPNVFTKKVRGAQEAHEAIRPTDFAITPKQLEGKISRDHYRLYSLIWQTAIASMMRPAEVKTTDVLVKSSAGYNLSAKGRELTFDGFLRVFSDSEERFERLTDLDVGEKLTLKSADPMQHFTEPPARYSEATLVRELERRGIGRPSTYAPIMSTIVERGYVTRQAGRFFPEPVAEVVTDLLMENFPSIIDYDFTAKMEESLDDIAEGKKELVPVIKDFYLPFEKLLIEKEKTIDKKAIIEEETDKICPKCQKSVVIKLGRFGKFYACSGYPDCDYTAPVLDDLFSPEQERQVAEEIKENCPDCGKPLALKRSRFGTFLGCSDYPKCKFTKAIVIGSGVPCPNCGHELVRKATKRGKYFWGCSGYPNCQTAFWDEPVNKRCPKCQHLLLKKKSGISCSQCDYHE
jgi:DNA topoisomerase-1